MVDFWEVDGAGFDRGCYDLAFCVDKGGDCVGDWAEDAGCGEEGVKC